MFFLLFSQGNKVYFRKKAATVIKARLSLKEKAGQGLLMGPRCENAAEGLRDVYFYSISFSSYRINKHFQSRSRKDARNMKNSVIY